MKITVEFLSLPNVVKMVGGKTITLTFNGQTVEDLIRELCVKYGKPVQKFLLDETGRLDMSFSMTINKQEWVRYGKTDTVLHDGDLVTIMMLAAGG